MWDDVETLQGVCPKAAVKVESLYGPPGLFIYLFGKPIFTDAAILIFFKWCTSHFMTQLQPSSAGPSKAPGPNVTALVVLVLGHSCCLPFSKHGTPSLEKPTWLQF